MRGLLLAVGLSSARPQEYRPGGIGLPGGQKTISLLELPGAAIGGVSRGVARRARWEGMGKPAQCPTVTYLSCGFRSKDTQEALARMTPFLLFRTREGGRRFLFLGLTVSLGKSSCLPHASHLLCALFQTLWSVGTLCLFSCLILIL